MFVQERSPSDNKERNVVIESTKVNRGYDCNISDLINALSVIAQDLDTIFFFLSRLAEREKELERIADIHKIARLAMIRAILFEENTIVL